MKRKIVKISNLLLIIILMFTLILLGTAVKASEGNITQNDLTNSTDINLTVEEYGKIEVPECNPLELTVDYSKEDDNITESIDVEITANTKIDLTIAQEPKKFDNKLDEWLSYKYKINNTEGSFGTSENNTEIKISDLNSGKKVVTFSAIFDLKAAKNAKWETLEAGNYGDDSVIKFTISSSE